jgi:hypothetical protein
MDKHIISILLVVCICLLANGCSSPQRTTPPAPRVVNPPAPAMPAEDVPPVVEGTYRPAVPDADKASLLYEAQVDLLRILICSEETLKLTRDTLDSDYGLQKASEHFTDMGFRVLDGGTCPGYNATAAYMATLANERDIDMFVLLSLVAQQKDKFGRFYSFEAEGRGKVVQISDKELVTTKSALVRGERASRASAAGESALVACAKELGSKLTDEILRKSSRGLLLRRVSVSGLTSAALVDYVRVGLQRKPGIQSVALSRWDQHTNRAVFLVRMDASVKENLAAYLEELDDIRLKVKRLDNTGAQAY